jgi:hypothetical protein
MKKFCLVFLFFIFLFSANAENKKVAQASQQKTGQGQRDSTVSMTRGTGLNNVGEGMHKVGHILNRHLFEQKVIIFAQDSLLTEEEMDALAGYAETVNESITNEIQTYLRENDYSFDDFDDSEKLLSELSRSSPMFEHSADLYVLSKALPKYSQPLFYHRDRGGALVIITSIMGFQPKIESGFQWEPFFMIIFLILLILILHLLQRNFNLREHEGIFKTMKWISALALIVYLVISLVRSGWVL